MSTENLTMTDAFTILLRKFNKLIENKPPVSEIKDKLATLREEAIIPSRFEWKAKRSHYRAL